MVFSFVLRASAAATLILLLHVCAACAQNSQFLFDATGNLLSDTTETAGLPQILRQPQNQVVEPGKTASFSVVVADTRNLTYHWFYNGAAIPGATSDTLLLTNISANNEGQYTVVLDNGSDPAISDPASLFIDSDADGLPDSWENEYFHNLNQTATGDADGDGVSNYQEFLDGTDPTNAASVLYHITLFADGGKVVFDPDQAGYTNGQVVTLTAIDSGTSPFHAWTGDVLTHSNSISLLMNTNRTVYAHFTPVTFQWTNTGGGDWNVVSNWMPNLIPGSNDSVRIVSGMTVSLNSKANLTDFTFGSPATSPTLSGSGTLEIHGTATWNSGTLSGTGRTVIDPGATLNMISDQVYLYNGTLENGGTLLCDVGNWNCTGAVITNRAGAVFGVGTPLTMFYYSPYIHTPSRVDNAGTFRKSVGGGTISVGANISFNNYGTVEIQSGTLALAGGGLNDATMTVPSGATLNFSSGTFGSPVGSSITGAGDFIVSGATANLAGMVNLSGTNTFSAGTANLTGDYICTNNTVIIAGGTANFSGSGPVAPTTLELGAYGTLDGSSVVTVGSLMDWSGGAMSGAGATIIPPGATLNVDKSNNVALYSRTLDNAGRVLCNAAQWNFTGGVITNRAGALFEVRSPLSLFWYSPYIQTPSRFDNAGSFRVALGSGSLTIGPKISFNNYSTVEVQSGTLALGGGGQNDSSIEVQDGSALNLSGGTFTSLAGSSITGAGNFIVSGATANLASLVNLSGTNSFTGGTANLTGDYICTNNTVIIAGGTANFSGIGPVAPAAMDLGANGTLDGSNVVTIGNVLDWSGGAMTGSGVTVIAPGATLNIAKSVNVALYSRTLDNAGTVLCNATQWNLTGGVVTNRAGALFEVQSPLSLFWYSPYIQTPSRFDNAGTFRESLSNGTVSVSSKISFNDFGTVDLQSGILAANGGYNFSSNSILNCAIGGTTAGAGYGQLSVGGPLTLGGALSVALVNGFSPSVGDSYAVVTAAALSGAFVQFNYPSNQVAMEMSLTPTSVIAGVTSLLAVPKPTLLEPQIMGSDFRLTWTAISNRTYRVEFNPSLDLSNWYALPGDVTALSNTASKLDPLTLSNRAYRVRLLP